MNTQQLWQAQALDAPRISLAFVRHQADALRRRTQMFNAFDWIVGLPGVTYLAWKCAESFGVEPLLCAATALWFAAGLICTFLGRKHRTSQELPVEFGVLDALRFHRRQLERQRDARLGNSRWLPLLFVPGHVMLFASFLFEITPIPWKAIIIDAVLIVFGTWIAIAMTGRSGRRIQKEIDALDSL
jgi:hypothetical protein